VKRLFWLIGMVLVCAAVMVGCAKQKGGVDTAPLQQEFLTAEAPVKADVQNAIAALEKGHHSEALAYLNKVAGKAKLTAEQQAVVKSTAEQVSAAMKAAAGKTTAASTATTKKR